MKLNPLRHRLSVHKHEDRFRPGPQWAGAEQDRAQLRDHLLQHIHDPLRGYSWLDSLLYERLFLERAVMLNAPAPRSDMFQPNSHVLRLLLRSMDQQAALAEEVVVAIQQRQRVLETILTHSCFASRQVELRERDLKRRRSSVDPATFLATHNSQTFSPSSSPLKQNKRSFTPYEMWGQDFLRLFLCRVTNTPLYQVLQEGGGGGGLDVCLSRTPRVGCTSQSHAALAKLLVELDEATDEVVIAVIRWRVNQSRPLPFLYQGHNILLLMQNDVDTIVLAVVGHLCEHAGGMSKYNAKYCPFYVVSRYSLTSAAVSNEVQIAASTRGGSVRSMTRQRAGMSESTGGKSRPVDEEVLPVLVQVLRGEQQLQLSLIDDLLYDVTVNFVSPTPLLLSYFPLPSRSAPEASPSSLPLVPVAAPSSYESSRQVVVIEDRPVTPPRPHGIPPFILDCMNDPAMVREYVARQGTEIVALPLRVEAPVKWFPQEAAVQRWIQPATTGGSQTTKSKASEIPPVAPRRQSELPLVDFGGGAPNRSASTVKRASSTLSQTSSTAYATVVVLNESGHLTIAGLIYLLHREIDRNDGSMEAVQNTFQWLFDCCQHAKSILTDTFGVIVEPHLQRLAEERANGKPKGQKGASSDGPNGTRDLDLDKRLDVLVELYFGFSAATTAAVSSSVASPFGEAVSPSKQHRASPLPPSPQTSTTATTLQDTRLVKLQRRTTRRFGLRILRSWMRLQFQRMSDRQAAADMEANTLTELLRSRFNMWTAQIIKNQQHRAALRELEIQTERNIRKAYFHDWRMINISRFVAKKLNAWLYQSCYTRWLYPVVRKRIQKQFQESTHAKTANAPWLQAMLQLSNVTAGYRPYLKTVAAIKVDDTTEL